jgi:hypothetical protein
VESFVIDGQAQAHPGRLMGEGANVDAVLSQAFDK